MLICKICNSKFLTIRCIVNFNELYEKKLTLGIPKVGPDVVYYQCTNCEFTFTNYLDSWSPEDLKDQIYNDVYHLIDDEYMVKRPLFNFHRFLENFTVQTHQSILDFGGGSGHFSRLFQDAGLKYAHSLDPYDNSNNEILEFYDYVTAFEVMEHCVNPVDEFQKLFSKTKQDGLTIISTLCVFDFPGSDPKELLKRFAYIAPCVGHVSIYSLKSLDKIAGKFGLKIHHLDLGYHIFYNEKYNHPSQFIIA
jgi:SAM-dependent methyltransferase